MTTRYRWLTILLLAVMTGISFFVYYSQFGVSSGNFKFKLGLDLSGGTELMYRADVSAVEAGTVEDSMATLRDVIERRINVLGVSEPIIQVEESSLVSGEKEHRLIVELPGVTNVQEAVAMIGQTPVLDFRLVTGDQAAFAAASTTEQLEALFVSTGLTGRLLAKARLEFNPQTREPIVALVWNDEGKELFAKITRENVGTQLAIFLDGAAISSPVIREEIANGEAIISGGFTPEEARTLVRNLNYGALPVPVTLTGTQTIGASLGEDAVANGVKAGVIGSLLVILFLIVWYRLPGVVASIALVMYVLVSLALFKLIPVTLTAAGLAGFILSIGMAVDANVLIFERMKEELKKGKSIQEAIKEGFHRAWLSIRDSNISSIITAAVLFWVGTSAVKGFAFTFGIGVLVSMFTAITASRTMLFAIVPKRTGSLAKFLFSNGLHFK
jgi:preprotein translocase subunit SecD